MLFGSKFSETINKTDYTSNEKIINKWKQRNGLICFPKKTYIEI